MDESEGEVDYDGNNYGSNDTPAQAAESQPEPESQNVLAAFGTGMGAGEHPVAAEYGEQLHLLREDAFDHLEDFIWQRDTIVYDEVEKMIRLTIGGGPNRNKWRNRLLTALYEVVCNLAWQEVAAHEPRTDKVSLRKLLATAFEGVISHYHLKATARDRLFVHFPERNWPTDLLAKVADLRAKQPTASWLVKACYSELLHRYAEEQQQVFFGESVYNTVST